MTIQNVKNKINFFYNNNSKLAIILLITQISNLRLLEAKELINSYYTKRKDKKIRIKPGTFIIDALKYKEPSSMEIKEDWEEVKTKIRKKNLIKT